MTSSVLAENVNQKELNTFLEAIKEKEDEELLIASDQFKDCKVQLDNFRKDSAGSDSDGTNKQKLQDCIADKIMGDPNAEGADEKLLQIAKNLSLSSYNPEASKTSKSIRDYLSKRIRTAIYGKGHDDPRKKLKEMQHVDHDVFYQLYAEQIGKNTLLEVSRYCLENFGLEKPEQFLFLKEIELTSEEGKTNTGFGYTAVDNGIVETQEFKDAKEKGSFELSKKYTLGIDDKSLDTKLLAYETAANSSLSDLWKNQKTKIKEYRVCNLPTKDQCDRKFTEDKKKTDYRSIYLATELKNLEFKLASKDPEKKLIKSRYSLCAGNILSNMCEIYKCNNVYNENTPENQKKQCEVFGIDKFSEIKEDATNSELVSLKSKNKKGFIACNIMGRLEEYRNVLKGIKVIQEDNKSLLVKSGFNLEGRKVYKSTGGKNSIDQLTSVSSDDLITGVEEFKNSEDNAAKLKEQCLEGSYFDEGGYTLKEGALDDPNCKILISNMDQAKLGVIQMDTEAKTKLKEQELDKLGEMDNPEELKEYLIKNGMDKYVDRLEDLEPKDLVEIIKQDFKAKRMAMIDNLYSRFEKERKIKTGDTQDEDEKIQIKNDIANQTIADVEVHKKRVETLFEYSNIVSSYLEIKNKETGETLGSNAIGRKVELDSNEELKQNGYFSSEEQSGGASGSLDYLSALDSILQTNKPKADGDDQNSTP